MADSIRDALTAAYDKAESDSAAADTSAPAPDNTAPVDSGPEPDNGSDEGAVPSSPPSDQGGSTPPASQGGATPPAAPAAPDVPAPVSWSNEERAAWAQVPKSARDAILRREGEMNRALQASAAARRRSDVMDQMAQPYKPLLDSYGIQVEDVIPNLLATRAALEIGTPQQKAQLVANLCADFGIEIGILDDALSARYAGGQPAPRYSGGPPQMQDLSTNPQLAPLFAMAAQYEEARQTRARAAIATVQNDPHYQAVRHTMADMIEAAHHRGQKLDLGVALALAKQAHGIAVPAAAPSVSEAARTLAAARNAASSVSGGPKPTAPRKPGEGSLRDELEANLAAMRR